METGLSQSPPVACLGRFRRSAGRGAATRAERGRPAGPPPTPGKQPHWSPAKPARPGRGFRIRVPGAADVLRAEAESLNQARPAARCHSAANKALPVDSRPATVSPGRLLATSFSARENPRAGSSPALDIRGGRGAGAWGTDNKPLSRSRCRRRGSRRSPAGRLNRASRRRRPALRKPRSLGRPGTTGIHCVPCPGPDGSAGTGRRA